MGKIRSAGKIYLIFDALRADFLVAAKITLIPSLFFESIRVCGHKAVAGESYGNSVL
jgi:hypothetical protein